MLNKRPLTETHGDYQVFRFNYIHIYPSDLSQHLLTSRLRNYSTNKYAVARRCVLADRQLSEQTASCSGVAYYRTGSSPNDSLD